MIILQYSPYGQRVLMALIEAKAEYTTYDVDMTNRPAWYIEKVNPTSLVRSVRPDS